VTASVLTLVAMAVAGAAGAVARYVVDLRVQAWIRSFGGGVDGIPWGTAAVNLVGAFLAGLAAGMVAVGALPPSIGSITGVGFLGAFTTFSTWMVQVVDLRESGRKRVAAVYLLGLLGLGLGAATLGLWVGSVW